MILNAREIRDRLKGRVDQQVMYVLEALAEQQGVLRQQMRELAMMMDAQTNIITNMVTVAEHMKTVTDRLKHMEHDDDLPPVTQ